jgi:hypothetical protein
MVRDGFRLGQDVFLIPYSRLSIPLSEKLMKQSTLPPLTTGDGSKAMAIQAGKASFYELQGWKLGSYLDYEAALRLLGNSNVSVAQKLDLKIGEDRSKSSVVELDVTAASRSLEEWNELYRRVRKLRNHGSLSSSVWQIADHLSPKPLSKDRNAHEAMAMELEALLTVDCPSVLAAAKRLLP